MRALSKRKHQIWDRFKIYLSIYGIVLLSQCELTFPDNPPIFTAYETSVFILITLYECTSKQSSRIVM